VGDTPQSMAKALAQWCISRNQVRPKQGNFVERNGRDLEGKPAQIRLEYRDNGRVEDGMRQWDITTITINAKPMALKDCNLNRLLEQNPEIDALLAAHNPGLNIPLMPCARAAAPRRR
jgi:hypothetical protein